MACTGSDGTGKPSKVELVPWDPRSEQHFKRMVEQRIACGWDQDEVPEWQTKALSGEKFLYWVVSDWCNWSRYTTLGTLSDSQPTDTTVDFEQRRCDPNSY